MFTNKKDNIGYFKGINLWMFCEKLWRTWCEH